ncbi:putative uncharacterized protein [Waddlia chondrophila 2032/99]|uniref:Uncharacterized protein n=2 Tax=Waddlia chondrophila TaxID=71667 RepID=D6YVP3_WADCW|nr:hypothetical protein [Waddlia chondrophila]ADI38204.1 hypothetical protein wcw_0838 [Waddlia chondrophila WSU 86-1044]CCB90334.1 putative uncharacterized protein [Waddlia chondrophila 2032/99]
MKSDQQGYQVKLWAIVGPLICLFSLFVISIKNAQVPFFLPFALLIGMPVCWRWRLWGWGGATLFLIACLAFEYDLIPLEERFWVVGISFSNSLALLITALSFEEVETQIESLGVESRSRLENLWKVDEKKQAIEQELAAKKEEVKNLKFKVRSFQKLIDLSTEEMHSARADHDKILQEFCQIKDENEKLTELLAKSESDPPMEAKYRQLREQFKEKANVLVETRRDLFLANEKISRLQRELDEERWYTLSEVEELLEKHILELSREKEIQDEQHQREMEALLALVDKFILK